MIKYAVFKFLDQKGKNHFLVYRLCKSSLVDRWIDVLKKNVNREDNKIHSFFMNYTYERFPEILKELNRIATNINQIYDRKLPLFSNTDFLDQEILNYLHEEYEIYGDRLESLDKESSAFSQLHTSFLRLNELIHICEIIIDQKDQKFSNMSMLFDYYPQGIHEPIEEKDKLYLTNEFQWGRLYLGYNTLGKDWVEISNHNDIDVIDREQVRPQQRFAAESWLYFSADCEHYINTVKFEKWYDSLSEEMKLKVPIESLNKLVLGRFEIGKLVIDEQFLKIHNNKSDWLAPNHTIKDKWNREVFSTFTKLVSVRIMNEKNEEI